MHAVELPPQREPVLRAVNPVLLEVEDGERDQRLTPQRHVLAKPERMIEPADARVE